MLRRRLDRGSAEPTVDAVVDAADLLAMREAVEQVSVHEDVLHYVVSLATATRSHPQVAVGASPAPNWIWSSWPGRARWCPAATT